MTSYNVGDIVLVPFPFTDQRGSKKRPAVVVNSAAYNTSRLDLILMTITSQIKSPSALVEVVITEWQRVGLLKASTVKPVVTTVEKGLVSRTLGRLEQTDRAARLQALHLIVG